MSTLTSIMDGDTATIWPGDRDDLIDELDDRAESDDHPGVENRNQAILDAIEVFLAVEDILGSNEFWLNAERRERESMIRQAIVDYRTEYLDE